MIPLSEPSIGELESRYVQEALSSGWVSSSGEFVTEFEARIADALGAKFAVATSSGTAALHLALLASGVASGDEVLVPTLTFIAPANAVRYTGAHPVFIDADPSTWQMDVDRVTEFLEEHCERGNESTFNKKSGRRVVALLPVDVLGHPVDMDPLHSLAERFHLKIVEDATESLGATYRGRPVGNLGDVGCLSFNGNKLITTGGGGMIVTDDKRIADRSRHLSTQARVHLTEYIHDSVGYNYRMSNLAAALGCAQIERMSDFVSRKKSHAWLYEKAFEKLPQVSLMPRAEWADPVYWLYTIGLETHDPMAVQEELAAVGIHARPLWQPMHLSPAHADATHQGGEVAQRIYGRALSLPSSVDLSDGEIARVVNYVSKAVTA